MNDFITASNGRLTKKRTLKSVIFATGMLLLGAVMVIGTVVAVADTGSSIYLLLLCVGSGLVLGFGAKLAFSRGVLVHAFSGSPVKPYSLFFRAEDMERLKQAIELGNNEALIRMMGDPGSGLRMDVLLSQNNQFAACQLFRYVPYHYEEASPVYPINEERCVNFCTAMRKIYALQSVE